VNAALKTVYLIHVNNETRMRQLEASEQEAAVSETRAKLANLPSAYGASLFVHEDDARGLRFVQYIPINYP